MSRVPPHRPTWRKSTHSRPDGDDCVEAAEIAGALGVRDSTSPHGPILTFTVTEWSALLNAIKSGAHDLP